MRKCFWSRATIKFELGPQKAEIVLKMLKRGNILHGFRFLWTVLAFFFADGCSLLRNFFVFEDDSVVFEDDSVISDDGWPIFFRTIPGFI